MRIRQLRVFVMVVCVLLPSCNFILGDADDLVVTSAALQLGDPIEGLPSPQLEAFNRGRVAFDKKFTPSEGLGPLYNATSCQACHSTPVSGGSAPNYRNFFIGAIGSISSQGPLPPLPSIVVPSYGAGASFTVTGDRYRIPLDFFGANVTTAMRNAPPIFGTGLFEFVTDATIIANSDPDDSDADGISGRFNRDVFGNLGRFGYKCQANNIEVFIRGAAFNQMGITTEPILGNGAVVGLHSMGSVTQAGGDPNDPTVDSDGVPDPESPVGEFGDIIAFNRFLAPPEPSAFSEAALRGQTLFDSVGCVKCHIPSLPTTLLDENGANIEINAFTDLLIHEMGAALADGMTFGVPQASSISPNHTANEFRTQPLWGVSFTAPFLHDGRADTLEDAIDMHGGEAQAIRDAFLALSQAERDDIIAFLEAL